ncbi:MAG: aminopeptidase [Lachnospiraceae bacterium]|nr:aminopeptidase [Lachnospiraceae bacterium]
MDPRVEQLAKNLVEYSCQVKKGDKVYIHFIGRDTEELARAIIKEVYRVGGLAFPHYTSQRVQREMLLHASKEQLELMAEVDSLEMSNMDCYIGIRGSENASELSDVPSERMALYDKYYAEPVHHQIRVPKTRWVVLRYPNAAMAQLAGSSQDAFEDFYFNVCNLDYSKMHEAMQPLIEYMNKTDKVRIVGPGTDISFSIKGIGAVPCSGRRNIPDGEVYTAPVRDSVNGTISYNTQSLYQGFTYENVKLTFKDGKIVEATANDTVKINELLDSDEGARYIGEFAIGVNPYIHHVMKDILFDEKIAGSIHFTPGNCYASADNGNHSVIHWDLVLIQTPEYGGGEIYFDDILIRKDGRFVVPELNSLNEENLK